MELIAIIRSLSAYYQVTDDIQGAFCRKITWTPEGSGARMDNETITDVPWDEFQGCATVYALRVLIEDSNALIFISSLHEMLEQHAMIATPAEIILNMECLTKPYGTNSTFQVIDNLEDLSGQRRAGIAVEQLHLPSLISYSVDHDQESPNAQTQPQKNAPDGAYADDQGRFFQGVSAWFNLPDPSSSFDGNHESAHIVVASHQETLDSGKYGRRQWVAHIAMVAGALSTEGDEVAPTEVQVFLFQNFCLMQQNSDVYLKLLANGNWNRLGMSTETTALARNGWSGVLRLSASPAFKNFSIHSIVLHTYCSHCGSTKTAKSHQIPKKLQARLVKGAMTAAITKLKQSSPSYFKSKQEKRVEACLPALSDAAYNIMCRFTLTPLRHIVLEEWSRVDEAIATHLIAQRLQECLVSDALSIWP
eukprot:jgi/Botrbrau1/4168/Bobra.0192s0035.6